MRSVKGGNARMLNADYRLAEVMPSNSASLANPPLAVLGLDPGLRHLGYAVALIDVTARTICDVIEVGTLETTPSPRLSVRKTSDDLRRAKEQFASLQRILGRNPISIVAAEMATTTPYVVPTFNFGVMTGLLAGLGPPIIEVLPYEVKIAATGSSRATKREIIAWALQQPASRLLGWPTSRRPNKLGLRYADEFITLAAEHPADALATIEAALATEQFRLATTLLKAN